MDFKSFLVFSIFYHKTHKFPLLFNEKYEKLRTAFLFSLIKLFNENMKNFVGLVLVVFF